MEEKAELLLTAKKEWAAPTCKSFGRVEDLTLNANKNGPIDPNSGQPYGGKCNKRLAGAKDCPWS
ncbi:MAG: hypothetical protein L3J49_05810 [Desulfobulbaceae bacterium]|nr:hypothetical protein [Desulfobulbaceae bacterium]